MLHCSLMPSTVFVFDVMELGDQPVRFPRTCGVPLVLATSNPVWVFEDTPFSGLFYRETNRNPLVLPRQISHTLRLTLRYESQSPATSTRSSEFFVQVHVGFQERTV